MGWYVILMSDSTYTYFDGGCTNSIFSEGSWRYVNDTLVLNSKFIPHILSQVETRERRSDEVKIVVNDITGSPWGCFSLNHVVPDSTYRLMLDFDYGVDDNDTIPHYHITRSVAATLGCNFSIAAGDYVLTFSKRDSLANKITVTLNYTDECFNDTTYLKDFKFLRSADTLFYLLQANIPYRDFPAYDLIDR